MQIVAFTRLSAACLEEEVGTERGESLHWIAEPTI